MKRISSVLLSLSMIASVVAPVAASAMTMSSNFNYNLTVGSKGDSVVALQSFLVSKGLLTMPAGVSMGYFGGLTKSAVAAYQISKGIQPTAGYFGPITRAAVNADMASMGGTTTTTTTTAGCSNGALYNSMTGASCTSTTTTTTTTSTSGVEGSLDVRLASNPTDNANIKTSNDVPVYGLEFRARIADVSVQTVDLQVSVTGSTAENPSTLINTIKVWDGSNVIATIPVNSTSFTRDQSQVYYLRLSGLNFLVPKDATKVLSFSFSTNSIDTDRTVVIDGYQLSSIRAVSGNGVSSFYSADALTRTHIFKKPGVSTLTLSAAASTLRSMNYRVNGQDALQNVTLAQFNLKSTSGDSTLLTVDASSTFVGTAPTTLYLWKGSTMIKNKPYAASVSFDNLDNQSGSVVPGTDMPVTYTISADFPSGTTNGTYGSTTINRVAYLTPNGNTASTTVSGGVTNVNQYVYTKAAVIKLASAPTISVQQQTVSGVGTTTVVATFPLTIQALGGNVVMPNINGADFTVAFSNGANTYTLASTTNSNYGSISVVTNPNNAISDGSTANVTVTASANGSLLTTSGLYNAGIASFTWNAGNGSTTQTYGFDDFKTSNAVQFTR